MKTLTTRIALCLFPLLCLVLSAYAADKPNIVVIVADDLGWADVGWHGSPIRTPNLDKLADEGVRLERHYVAPMCSPTRAALMTGRYWSRFGVTGATNDRCLPFDTVTLPRALNAAGYDTALTGKWHLGSLPEWGPNRFGFDHAYGSLAGGVGPYDHFYKKGPYTRTWHRNGELMDEEGHVTDLIAREAVRWIESRTERPFFLYVPFTAPHIPIDEPKEWLELNNHIEDPAYRLFAACVSHMDAAIGRIVKAIDKAGKLENTLIVFFSDNGATPRARNDDPQYPPGNYRPGPCGGKNDPLRGHKTQLYEGGIRVPAFARWPRRLEAGVHNSPIHVADWMPTLCHLAGHEPSRDLKWDGTNVWPWLTGAVMSPPRTLYWAGVGHRSSAIRQGDWKLIVTKGDAPKEELFNLRADPNEENDLAAAHPEQVRALTTLLERQISRDSDALPKDPEPPRAQK